MKTIEEVLKEHQYDAIEHGCSCAGNYYAGTNVGRTPDEHADHQADEIRKANNADMSNGHAAVVLECLNDMEADAKSGKIHADRHLTMSVLSLRMQLATVYEQRTANKIAFAVASTGMRDMAQRKEIEGRL